jgi:O-antigen/teichoic acid export membrane protein
MTETARRPGARGPGGRLARNASLVLGARGLSGLVNLAAAAVAVRAAGVEAFGFVVMLQAYVRVVGGLARFESWSAVIRYGAEPLARGATGDVRRLAGFTLRLDLIAFAAAVAVAALAAPQAGEALGWSEEAIRLAPWYALVIPFISGATPTGLLRLLDRFDILAAQAMLSALTRLAGAALVLALGGGLTGLAASWAVAGVVPGLWMMLRAAAAARRAGVLPRLHGGWSALSAGFPGIWRFVALTNGAGTLETVAGHASVLVTGGLLGATGAGLYGLVRQLTEPLAKLRSLLAAAGVAAVLALAGEAILTLLFGPQAAAAAPLLAAAGAGASVAAGGFPLPPALLSLGREGAVFATAAASAALFAALLAWLVPAMGLLGAGLALLGWQSSLVLLRLLALRAALRGAA